MVLARDGIEANQILLSPDGPKLALVDWLMPGIDGAQLCRNMRRHKPEPYTYIILLTGRRSQSDVIAGLEAGADDYIRKPFDPAELKVRLRTGKRILYLQERLISAREEASLGLVMADLDCFKHVNDTYGHPTGDEVLRATGRAMRNALRRYDAIGRYGGDEFLIVLPGCDESNSVSHAERLRAAVSRIVVETPSGSIQVKISLGVVISDRHSSLDVGELIQAADAALYRAKHEGRDRVEFSLSM